MKIVKTPHPSAFARNDWWIEDDDGRRDGPYDSRRDAKFVMDYRARRTS